MIMAESNPAQKKPLRQRIAEAGAASFPVSAVEVVHRCGRIRPGEAIVWVAVASAHRRAAFDAADFLSEVVNRHCWLL